MTNFTMVHRITSFKHVLRYLAVVMKHIISFFVSCFHARYHDDPSRHPQVSFARVR